MKNPFRQRTESADSAEAQPDATSAPDTKPTNLRERLKAKLLELVEQGNVQAIRELLDRPNLFEPAMPMDFESAQKALGQFLDEVKARQPKEEIEVRVSYEQGEVKNPGVYRRAFEDSIEARLKVEEESETALAGWKRMSAEEKLKLWDELRAGLKELGELAKEYAEGRIQ